MTLSMSAHAFAILVLVTQAATCSGSSSTGLDTNRDPKLFRQPSDVRKAGYEYFDTFSVFMSSQIDSDGMSMKITADLAADSTMIVSSLSRGGQKIDFKLEDIQADVDSFLFMLHCDSNDRSGSSPDCLGLFDIVGTTETLVVNDAGNIVRVSGPDGSDLTENVMPISSKFSGAQHYETHSQLMGVIPDRAVKPGDTWADEFDMSQLGVFKGTSSLEGYLSYGGSDCAVFSLGGRLHMDLAMIAQSLLMDPEDLPINSVDADITMEVYWDYTNQIARWSQMNVTTAFDIDNPTNPSAGKINVPVQISVSTGTDIVVAPTEQMEDSTSSSSEEGPEHDSLDDDTATTTNTFPATTTKPYVPKPYVPPEESKQQKVAYVATSSQQSSSSSESSSSSSGFGFVTFMMLLVVIAGAAGFVFYTKKNGESSNSNPFEMVSVSRPPTYSPIV